MSTVRQARFEPVLPTDEEEKLALEAAQAFARHLHGHEGGERVCVKLSRHGGSHDEEVEVLVPSSAVKLLIEALSHMANGNAVMVLPIHREVSTQQAADLLNVSRPYLIRLLERGEMPFRQVGTRRRVQLKDVLAYRARYAARRRQVLDELTAQAEELDLY